MYTYHTQYKFKRAVVNAVRRCGTNGLWRARNAGDMDGALALLKQLAKDLCEIYNIRMPYKIFYGDGDRYWRIGRMELRSGKPSLVSFLHEYRHHYQFVTGKKVGNEKDCRAYSLGLFRVAFPDTFEGMWRENRMLFMPPYTTNDERSDDILEVQRESYYGEEYRRRTDNLRRLLGRRKK